MPAISGELRVHLDHLIKRQSIRYAPKRDNGTFKSPDIKDLLVGQEDRQLRYQDIHDNTWFRQIRKPDFQRETNAWKPTDCVEFLDSVVNGRIIPSVILWHSQDNELIYVLDGAHRLSVIRAWMIDDWGDRAGTYYERRDQNLIIESAQFVRDLVRSRIGAFSDFESAYNEFVEMSEQERIPKQLMGDRYPRAIFYNRAMIGRQGISLQWERGNYESAEQSFLRINRSGQALDAWEATLIEYRRSSYARCVMSIANGGEEGHYWPEPSEGMRESLGSKVSHFSKQAEQIYKSLFVPPYLLPITDLNVPMLVAPGYFQKHKYLMQLIPLVVDRQIAINEDQQLEIMRRDAAAEPERVIDNGSKILTKLEAALEHFVSPTHSSTSLSIVPLFYWYNQKGQNIRGLLYGFMYWLLSGTEEEITNRKLVFSANRDRFEHMMFELKTDIADLQDKTGAGLKVTTSIARFFQDLLDVLHTNQKLTVGSEELENKVIESLQQYTRVSERSMRRKSRRTYSQTDRSQINVRKLFESSIRCHICGGIVNLQQGGIQYDHTEDYALSQTTDPDTGEPTHAFCNRYKPQIVAYRRGKERISLPKFSGSKDVVVVDQLSFWGVDNFPV